MNTATGAQVAPANFREGGAAPAAACCDYCHLPVPRQRRARAAAPDGAQYCCYGCRLAAQVTQARGEAGQVNWLLTRLAFSVFLTMGVMVFTLYLYSQEVYGSEMAAISPLQESLTGVMRYLSLLFATPVFFILGWPIGASAVEQMRRGVLSTDALVMVGVAAAFLYSYISTLSGAGATYYETACMILVLVTFGRWLEATAKLKAGDTVKALAGMLPDQTPVRVGTEVLLKNTADLRPGDRVLVRPGQRVPVDGIVEEGRAALDTQMLTGESTAATIAVGDAARAGTVPLDGTLIVRADRVGGDSTLGRFVKLLEQARASRGRYERLADRLARIFVPLTAALALLGAGLGWTRGGFDQAVMTALAVLLIACPCALGIATPLALWAGLGQAARKNVLFRNVAALESLAGVQTVCFDKTGTLTTGNPEVVSFTADPQGPHDEATLLGLAAGLAQSSAHPYARSIVLLARRRGLPPFDVTAVSTTGGRGVIGKHGATIVQLGNLAYMNETAQHVRADLQAEVQRVQDQGLGIACLSVAGQVSGVFAFAHALRPQAEPALEDLHRLHCGVQVLTGDHARQAARTAQQLGVEVIADLTPEGKIDHLRELQRRAQRVALVGDGLNDAPALSAADVGVALGCGADLSRESADACLLDDDLLTIPWLVQLSRRVVRTIKTNLFWAFFYNVIGIGLALNGLLNPILAAGAMVLSSTFVVSHSLRLARPVEALRT